MHYEIAFVIVVIMQPRWWWIRTNQVKGASSSLSFVIADRSMKIMLMFVRNKKWPSATTSDEGEGGRCITPTVLIIQEFALSSISMLLILWCCFYADDDEKQEEDIESGPLQHHPHKTLLRPAQNLLNKSLSTCPQQRWSLCGGSSLSYSSAVGATVPPMPERVEFASRTEQRERMNDAVSRVVPIKNQAYPPKIRFLLILPLWPPQGIGCTKQGQLIGKN